ncbi:transglycosylase domain-containing protein [Helicobacter canis]|uniref:PBP1A family penicillin-binding protein n=1 Tax=Helicobacter canis TaxID=29419 RepID=A0A5M9QRV4_9HELI|nr:PBP1A family penicillin-binding protein [Helicobacter canis]KAA8710779.1 PBP1A family penicillin-binding protein [Helicobacter canis]
MIKKALLSLIILTTFIGVAYVVLLYKDLSADIDKVKHYTPKLASQIYDRKNRLIANVFDTEFRFYAKFDEIPPRMIEALLAIEDTLFFEHSGINYDAIIRAMVKNIKNGRFGEGGSTLTQQLVKNVILTRERTFSRKLKEALLTIQVERVLSKEQILEIYLNEVFFGHGYHGVKTAALGYFKKPLSMLSLKEIAMLVGLPNAPSIYDPTKRIDFSLARANDVIRRMYDLGWISKEYAQSALAEAPVVYNQTLTQNIAPYVTDFALRQLSGIKDIKTGGYTIKLNIDLEYQALAQQALINGYNGIQARLQKVSKNANAQEQDEQSKTDTFNGAMVVTDTRTGKILALVGGVDFAKSPFNRATDANRQIGSSVKPFIYQIALDKGYSTATKVPDAARDFDGYRAGNVDKSFRGLITLQEALMFSRNLATLNIVQLVGFNAIYNGLLEYGFKDLNTDMTIAIGSLNATPLMLAREYSIFSNYGTRVDPILIDSVIDINGNVFTYDTQQATITSAQQAFLGVSILREVVANGTGRRARVNGVEVAGKTGTTNNNVDFWFCGFTPDVQAIVWFGRDDSKPIGQYESAGLVAAPVFAEFVGNVLRLDPAQRKKFPTPENVSSKMLDKYNFYYTSTSPLPSSSNTAAEQDLW